MKGRSMIGSKRKGQSPILHSAALLLAIFHQSSCWFHVASANPISPTTWAGRSSLPSQSQRNGCGGIWGVPRTFAGGRCAQIDKIDLAPSRSRVAAVATALRARGGSAAAARLDDDDASSSDDYDDTSEDYDSEDEYDEYYESENEEEAVDEIDASGEDAVVEYDEQLRPSFMQTIGSSVGVMYLSRNIDLFDPKIVKKIRFAFVAYAIAMQVFLAYVRIKAKLGNDRTKITVKNPMSALLQKQLPGGEGGANDMVKNIASQFLSSETTVMEYDLKEAKKMGNSLLFPLILMWFMHFKLGQVQPLLFQISSGVMNLIYSPLFQIYVLGRNLERPFKAPTNPMAERMQELQKQQQEQLQKQQETAAESAGDSEAVEANADEESEGEEEDDDESESEYDDEDESDSESDDSESED